MRPRSRCRRRCTHSKRRQMSDARHHGQDALESVRALFSAAHRMDPVGVRAGLAFSLGGSVLRPLYPLLFKILVDAALGGRTETAIWAGLAIGVVSAVGGAAGGYASMYLWNVWERMSIVIDEQLVGLTTRLGLLSQMEDPELADHMTLILTNRHGFQESMMSLLFSANLLVQVAITVVILVSVAPVLLLLPLFAIAPVVASRWAERRTQEVMKATSPITRTANGFVMLGIDPQAAGELRVLRVRELILERQRRAWDEVIRMQWRAETAGAIVTTLALLAFTIGFGGSILLVTARSIRGARPDGRPAAPRAGRRRAQRIRRPVPHPRAHRALPVDRSVRRAT